MSYSHKCEAQGCTKRVPSEMLMCRRHWFMVPKDLRCRVWAGYHRGMDDEYHVAVAAAVDAVQACEASKR